MPTLSGQIVLPDRVLAGAIGFDDRIRSVEARPEASSRLILPGFIDTHVHGGGGGDCMDGAEGIRTLARFHLAHGTTTLLPTTMTRPWDEVLAALAAVGAVRAEGVRLGADIHGAHLEGPFLSPQRLGAQPPFAVPPDRRRVEAALAAGIVRVVTIAPELDGALPAMRRFAAAGVRVSLGHTACSFEQAQAAIEAVLSAGGVVGGTHLFNAMGGIEARAPGLAWALLGSEAAHAELILDTHHVHPALFLMAHKAIGNRLLLITDCMRAGGQRDGNSELGGRPVSVSGGIARLADGTLAGSVLTLDQALRNAVAAGVPLARAARLLSLNPARYLGLEDRGALHPGLRADLVVTDDALEVLEVWREGERMV